ncbi:hypothetical protein [Burkholderia cenocepacia]|uniref:hypothetical protein n=1 Tax=Burkholderia cenocepacia TaxID=95486 RepID=UPI00406CF526
MQPGPPVRESAHAHLVVIGEVYVVHPDVVRDGERREEVHAVHDTRPKAAALGAIDLLTKLRELERLDL